MKIEGRERDRQIEMGEREGEIKRIQRGEGGGREREREISRGFSITSMASDLHALKTSMLS